VNVFVVNEEGRIVLADHLRDPRTLVEWLRERASRSGRARRRPPPV